MSIFDVFARLEKEKASKEAASGPVEWLIVGLGNPGAKYDGTRHNAGFRALEHYCKVSGQKIDRMKFKALVGEGQFGGARVLFMKPQTFMNLSGEAVRDAAAFYKLDPSHIIVLSDDISLDVGRIRVRGKGSAGGQNGLKNIIYHLNTEQFPRVKIGVGAKPHPDYDLADWVLSRFTNDEQEAIDSATARAMQAAEEIVRSGAASAAQKFNGK
ncbi:MAG: aminoacyl-tRNA hydrolase [Butyricicoccus pullicaecorum]|nr:aminoacyl-tRNA hydrolase [Butyricicoccus pullicaecorum]